MKKVSHRVASVHSRKSETPADEDEITRLYKKLKASENPDEADIQRYRELAVAHPDRCMSAISMSELVRRDLMKRLLQNYGVHRALLMAEEDVIKKELGYNSSSQMEKLIIEQILTTKLHLLHAEHVFNQRIMESKSYADGDYWQRFFSAAHRRHLQAVESLARVRRLMRGGPFVQVNIANPGGKQVNLQGELFQRSHSNAPVEANSLLTHQQLANSKD